MSLYGRMYRRVWRLRAGKVGREIFSRAAEMTARERTSIDELTAYQASQLQALLRHAYASVPFWRARMDAAGLDPEAVNSPQDLTVLPTLTKQDVRAHSKALIADTHQDVRLIANATGGSTGEPIHFWQDEHYLVANRATKLRHRRWHGYDFGERIVFLWGAHRDTKVRSLRHGLRRRLRQEEWVNAFRLDENEMLRFVHLLNDWQPQLVVAYPSALQAFARFVQQKDLHVRRTDAIECSAEKLWAEQRREIEMALNVPIFDVYGSREFGAIAAECPAHQGLHLFSDNHVIEVLKNGKPAEPGEIGEILVTCLTNHAMPFIRYRTGDLGVLSAHPCACGRTLPLLTDVIGRSNAVVSLSDGRLVHGAFFSYFFYHQPGVQRYRVHQSKRDEIRVLVEGDDKLTESRLQTMAQSLSAGLNDPIKIVVSRTDGIEPLPSGKLGYLISDVPVNFIGSPAPEKVET